MQVSLYFKYLLTYLSNYMHIMIESQTDNIGLLYYIIICHNIIFFLGYSGSQSGSTESGDPQQPSTHNISRKSAALLQILWKKCLSTSTNMPSCNLIFISIFNGQGVLVAIVSFLVFIATLKCSKNSTNSANWESFTDCLRDF